MFLWQYIIYKEYKYIVIDLEYFYVYRKLFVCFKIEQCNIFELCVYICVYMEFCLKVFVKSDAIGLYEF